MDKKKLLTFIKQLGNAVEQMSDAELQDFFDDSSSLTKRPRLSKLTSTSKIDEAVIDGAIESLKGVPSREEGLRFLAKTQFTRRHLSAMAKRSYVHITKEDSVSQIQEKLVEALIGSRLNSRAIRGVD